MVKVGQQGQVYLDSFPKQPLLAKVTRGGPKASFTPENIFPKTELLRCLASNLPSKIPKAWLNRECPPMVESYQQRSQNALLRCTFCWGF